MPTFEEQITESEQALFDVLIAMAESFDDGHVQIESPGGLEGDGWVNEYPYYAELDTIEVKELMSR